MAMDEEARLATTALVIAVVALVIATGQFLQQIFGTAEGFRRCQESVIGPWARRTRLSWRWQGFRFETKFTTPSLVYLSTSEHRTFRTMTNNEVHFLDSAHTPRDTKFSSKAEFPELPAELKLTLEGTRSQSFQADTVTWMPLLKSIYEHEKRVVNHGQDKSQSGVEVLQSVAVHQSHQDIKMHGERSETHGDQTFAAVELIERSWDLIPPDVVRPFAHTTVGSLITTANRLGIRWQDFRPGQGVLNAQGNGHSIWSTNVRGLGILCEYRYDHGKINGPTPSQAEQMIVSRNSDALRCGCIPQTKFLGPNASVIPLVDDDNNDRRLIEVFLDRIKFDKPMRTRILEQVGEDLPAVEENHLTLVVAEAIGILAPFLPVAGSCLTRFSWPLRNRRDALCVFLFWEGRATLLYRLKQRCRQGASTILQCILCGIAHFEEKYPHDFYCRWDRALATKSGDSDEKADFIEFFRKEHSWASDNLKGRSAGQASHRDSPDEEDEAEDVLFKVFSKHSRMAARALEMVASHASSGERFRPYLNDNAVGGPGFVEPVLDLADLYVDQMQGDDDEEKWWLMAYRAICWYATMHLDFSQDPLPSSYFESGMPVYLG